MRKVAAVVLSLVVVGGIVAAVVLRRGGEARRPPVTTPTGHRLLIGFLDDANFRWRPYRSQMLHEAHDTGARLVRALVYWNVVAPDRPRPGRPPFIEPRLYEIDELVASASARHMQVLFTIWGTPKWANGGQGPNYPPSNPNDFRVFAHALAARYPQVHRYAVWNEPNTEQFLAPQFDAAGRSVGPELYAQLYRAAYTGIKEANPHALVAIGETSSHGKDAPSRGRVQDSHSPARFAYFLSRERPRLHFDAWAHHPYPVGEDTPPDRASHWPSVQCRSTLDHRVRLRVVEGDPHGVSADLQADYAAHALALAANVPRVQLFVWFTFRDDHTNAWQSGLLDASGRERPVYKRFAAEVHAIDG